MSSSSKRSYLSINLLKRGRKGGSGLGASKGLYSRRMCTCYACYNIDNITLHIHTRHYTINYALYISLLLFLHSIGLIINQLNHSKVHILIYTRSLGTGQSFLELIYTSIGIEVLGDECVYVLKADL